jgi:predicted TIM-barrel fold metal-dependent hydrolase
VRSFGAERVLFGSDFPFFDPAESFERLESAGLSHDEFDAVTLHDAEAMFDLSSLQDAL